MEWLTPVSLYQVANVMIFLSYFLLGSCSVPPASVDVKQQESVVIFRGSPCRKTPDAQLREQMGDHFDTKRMSMSSKLIRPNQLQGQRESGKGVHQTKERLPSVHQRSRRRGRGMRRRFRARNRGVPSMVTDDTFGPRGKRSTFPQNLSKPHLNHHAGYPHHPKVKKGAGQENGKEDAIKSRLPWQCKMEQHWKRMPEGTFPLYIQSGHCTQTTCMLDTYSCSPVKYTLKVLKRNPDACDPIPTIGNETIYEEKWQFSPIKVIVFCECSQLRPGFQLESDFAPG